MASRERRLNKKDYVVATLRSYILQNGFNYTNYQGTGYANIIFPGLKKIYKDDEEALKKATTDNIEFYNVNPQTVPFVSSLQLAMLDYGEDTEKIRSIKMALMGPLAGIGDAISQFGIAPLFSTIFASMAMAGITGAPIMFLVTMIAVNLFIKGGLGWLGYKMGTSAIETLSKKINQVSRAANIIGVTVISGLAVNFVKAKIGLEYATTIDGQEQLVSLQTVLDQILPRLLPAVITIGVLYLIKKRNWNVYKLLALLIVMGVVLSYLGILV
ncbi:MAG TPA: PTS system mannose/fructose/sorbose family transporter subunit IID [Candidatus Jeotgalibaca merdavium]|uniref:PTS system mannose/fructose/sorbose family transporter subunit IID n=1 Tax=Candidatus Jeotgalibaca merdavium TaxID=2838627 RepID=A0A9D2I0P1_9LACT|nr:PTS system mannose/fructose/sorbose family transporter subunit IID [Candidatus Jeotgalibaca merdavium]